MESKKIIVVYSFGGQWEDKWENLECAFLTKEAAEKYMQEQTEIQEKISDEQFDEIEEHLANIEYDIQCKYYDPTTGELYKDKTEEEWSKEYDEFEENEKYKIIQEKWGFTKEEYEKKQNDRTYDFCGYMTKEIELFEE